ncbi:MAG: hypothetical protein ABID38_04310 [Candidatus Diapherotrites archaeon]
MRRIVVLLLIVLLAASAFAISVETDKASYEKGEFISITGECLKDTGLTLLITASGRKLHEEKIYCNKNSRYFLNYKTSFLDPKAKWDLKVLQGGEDDETQLYMYPKNEGAFYLITFLSPSPGKYKKGEDLTLSVKVLDAGEAVTDANVISWGVMGEKLQLENRGGGIYSIDLAIPFDSEKTAWDFIVLAQSAKRGNIFGGEQSLGIEIESAQIIIEVIQPEVHEYDLSTPLPLEARIKYSDGKAVKNLQEIGAEISGVKILLSEIGEGLFSSEHLMSCDDAGSVSIRFFASDTAGNSGQATKNIVATGQIGCFLRDNWIYILVIIVLVVTVSLFAYSRLSHNLKTKLLKNERDKTMNLIKSLQEDYFTKGVMPAISYKKNLAKYQAKINELDKKIKDLEGAKK